VPLQGIRIGESRNFEGGGVSGRFVKQEQRELTLASQAEIGVWVQAPELGASAEVQDGCVITSGKNFEIAILRILAGKWFATVYC